MPDATDDAPSFSAAVARNILVRACELAGLDDNGARPLRLGENALFHLPAEAVVVRIARTMDYWTDASKEVAVSRWLSTLGRRPPSRMSFPLRQVGAGGR